MIISWLSKLGITMLIHVKDDIEFVTEFPCLLGRPVEKSEVFNSDTISFLYIIEKFQEIVLYTCLINISNFRSVLFDM